MSQPGGSTPPNLRGAFGHRQRSYSDSLPPCDQWSRNRQRGRTFSGRQPSELFLPSTLPPRHPSRTSPSTSSTPSPKTTSYISNQFAGSEDRYTSVSPPLSRAGTYNSRNPYRNHSPPSPINERPL